MLDLAVLKKLRMSPTLGLKRWVSTHSSYIIAVVYGKIPEKKKRRTGDFVWDFSVDDALRVHYYFYCHSCMALLHTDNASSIADGRRLFSTANYSNIKASDWNILRTLDQCIVCECMNHVWPIFRDYVEVEPLIKKAVEKRQKELNSAKR